MKDKETIEKRLEYLKSRLKHTTDSFDQRQIRSNIGRLEKELAELKK